MAHVNHFSLNFNINPPPAPNTQVSLALSPDMLKFLGFNMAVEVSTATAFRQQPSPPPLRSLMIMAHFDTGASISTIDDRLANHLGLIPIGSGTSMTANGPRTANNYAIDLTFINTQLAPMINLQVGSCTLPFDLAANTAAPNDPKNFGMLLGRDVMSRWNIVWNGPTSTVLISD